MFFSEFCCLSMKSKAVMSTGMGDFLSGLEGGMVSDREQFLLLFYLGSTLTSS